jgi:hypothetical protein
MSFHNWPTLLVVMLAITYKGINVVHLCQCELYNGFGSSPLPKIHVYGSNITLHPCIMNIIIPFAPKECRYMLVGK